MGGRGIRRIPEAHRDLILGIFGSELPDLENPDSRLGKHHNVRSLITALEGFYRIYYHLTRANAPDIEPYLCSFVSYYLAVKAGISRDGKPTFTFPDEDIRTLSPRSSRDPLFESVRLWIRFGYWNKDLFLEELGGQTPLKSR